MKTTAEMKIEISNARISNAIIMPDGTCKLELEVEKCDSILVEASKLSLKDKFMRYKPKTVNEKMLKTILIKIIENEIEDFYRPTMDPSFAINEKTKIHYKAGEKPAVGKSYNWWEDAIKDSKWCFGSLEQYVAFLGVLIKRLSAHGWRVKDAWNAVCNDSSVLGHYYNSNNAQKNYFESTGSREICGFFDLGNTQKILAKDEEKGAFYVAGGCYRNHSTFSTLAEIDMHNNFDNCDDYSVPWLVLK